MPGKAAARCIAGVCQSRLRDGFSIEMKRPAFTCSLAKMPASLTNSLSMRIWSGNRWGSVRPRGHCLDRHLLNMACWTVRPATQKVFERRSQVQPVDAAFLDLSLYPAEVRLVG